VFDAQTQPVLASRIVGKPIKSKSLPTSFELQTTEKSDWLALPACQIGYSGQGKAASKVCPTFSMSTA
jgi:hypothetical protein